MTSKSKVYFFFDNVRVSLAHRSDLKKNIEKLIKREGKRLDTLTYIFCSDKKLLDINRRYLKHDFYTDIITFDLSEKRELLAGEIYISIDRVKQNAQTFHQTLKREIRRVIFHGALHLCGYEDKTRNGAALMREKEDYYLSGY